jgi:hypothetical protein
MLTHSIPRYNWRLTERYLKTLDYLEGRDYQVDFKPHSVTLSFSYKFQYERYWDQWGKHIAPVVE